MQQTLFSAELALDRVLLHLVDVRNQGNVRVLGCLQQGQVFDVELLLALGAEARRLLFATVLLHTHVYAVGCLAVRARELCQRLSLHHCFLRLSFLTH